MKLDYPDHRAVGIPDQFRFHMQEFGRIHAIPENWDHADPFTHFSVWNYEVTTVREMAAFTITGKRNSFRFAPMFPAIPARKVRFILDEDIELKTDAIYQPSENYIITDYNRSSGIFQNYGRTG